MKRWGILIPGPTPPWVHLNFSLGTVKKRVTLSGAPSIKTPHLFIDPVVSRTIAEK